jgi:hypothetical protein
MMHVALGWQYRGRRVKQGAVVYCAPEGAHGFKARIEAFRQTCLAEQAEAIPFYLVPATMALVKDHRALIADIRSKLGDIVPAPLSSTRSTEASAVRNPMTATWGHISAPPM